MNWNINKQKEQGYLTPSQAIQLKTIVTNSYSDLASYLEQKQEELRQIQNEHNEYINQRIDELENQLRLLQ